MKSNEFKPIIKTVNEDTPSDYNYGWEKLKQFGRRLSGNPEGQMSVDDKMVKEIFLKRFQGQLVGALNSQIQSGAVDPKINSASSAPSASNTMAPSAATTTQPAAGTTSPTTPTASGTAPTPAQSIAQTRQQKTAVAATAAQKSMKAVPGANVMSNMVSQLTKPAAGSAAKTMTPQQINAMKGKLKAGQGMGAKTQSGFSNYVAGSGQRLQGADAQGNPVFKNIQRESKYNELNSLFESIILNEAISISDYIKKFALNYLKTYTNVSSPELIQSIDKYAKEIESTYIKDKGMNSINKLANYAYGEIAAGNMSGSGIAGKPGISKSGVVAQPGATAQPELKAKQVKAMLDQMTTQQRQKVFSYLQQLLAQTPPAAPAAPTSAVPESMMRKKTKI